LKTIRTVPIEKKTLPSMTADPIATVPIEKKTEAFHDGTALSPCRPVARHPWHCELEEKTDWLGPLLPIPCCSAEQLAATVKDLCPCVRAAAKDFAIGTRLYGGLALFSVSSEASPV
jgi:hypothetical protein